MSAIADRALLEAARNPRLKLLPGVVELARADDLITAKDYQGALAAAIRAQSFGEHWEFFENGERRKRSSVISSQPSPSTIAPWPCDPSSRTCCGSARTFSTSSMSSSEQARASRRRSRSTRTEELENRASYAGGLEFAGNKHFNAGRAKEALAAYELALFIQPDRAEARRWRDELLRRGNPNQAPDEIDRLTERARKEDVFEAYLALDGALAKRGRFTEVVEHWTEYLARHPEDGKGYLERGGAYRAIRQMDAAIRDAEKACELGVAKGCEVAKRFAPKKYAPPITARGSRSRWCRAAPGR